jgi:hypothetical protein
MDNKAKPRREFENEFLQKLVDLRNEDLKFADAKAGVLLTLAIAVAAAALAALEKRSYGQSLTATPLAWVATGTFLLACLFTALAVVSAVRAVKPRVDAEGELPETVTFGGGFQGMPDTQEDRKLTRDLMSAPVTAAIATPTDYLKALRFVEYAEGPENIMAAHCLRTARSAYVKYRFIHAATRWIALEVVTFVIAGIFFTVFVR